MYLLLAGVLFLIACAIPWWLLHRFHAQPWYWHVLAVVVALVIGLMPGTALLNAAVGTQVYGMAFFILMAWGIGGLLPTHKRRDKLA